MEKKKGKKNDTNYGYGEMPNIKVPTGKGKKSKKKGGKK